MKRALFLMFFVCSLMAQSVVGSYQKEAQEKYSQLFKLQRIDSLPLLFSADDVYFLVLPGDSLYVFDAKKPVIRRDKIIFFDNDTLNRYKLVREETLALLKNLKISELNIDRRMIGSEFKKEDFEILSIRAGTCLSYVKLK